MLVEENTPLLLTGACERSYDGLISHSILRSASDQLVVAVPSWMMHDGPVRIARLPSNHSLRKTMTTTSEVATTLDERPADMVVNLNVMVHHDP